MPMITVNILAGRSPEMKHRLITALTTATATSLEVPADRVRIILNEVPPEHWAVGGETKAPLITAPEDPLPDK